MTVEEAALEKLRTLPINRKQELLDFAELLEQAINKPRRSLKGALADLNIKFTEVEIREARNEMWRGFMKDTE